MTVDLYQRNLHFFKENKPAVLEQIKDKDIPGHYPVCPAREKGMYYIASTEEGGLLLHSRYNPVREAELWATKEDLEGKRHAVLFGLGCGYHAEALLRRDPDLSLYIYEPDLQVFLDTLPYRDWSGFPWEHVYIVFEDGSGKESAFIEYVLNLIKDDWCFLSIPAFERCFSGQFSVFKESLLKLKTAYLDSLRTNIFFEKEWTVNALQNLPYILECETVFAYKDDFQGQTAVMTASGPSLTGAIPFLREIKERRKALLVAAGTSINGLLKHGLLPDFFVSYDPFPGNYRALKPALAAGVPFVFGSTINHDVVKNHVGPRTYFILGQDTLFSYLRGGLNPGEVVIDAPSIAVVTLQLLDKLGIKEIILAGQDLAFPGDRFYAEGVGVARSEDVGDKDRTGAFEVEANDGGKVLTNRSLDKMRQSMELLLQSTSFSRVVNTSSGGAQIAGTIFEDWTKIRAHLPDGAVRRGISFDKPGTAGRLRSVRRRVHTVLDGIGKDFAKLLPEIKKFLEKELEEDKQQAAFDGLFRYVTKLTASRAYAAFIGPMIRNEDHLLRKILPDLPKMSWEEKKEFVRKDLMMYLRGVELSLLKLKDAVEGW